MEQKAPVGGGSDWRTGPAYDRGRYRVARPTPLPGGQGFVFKARGPSGDVALKLLGAVDDQRFAVLHARWEQVAADPHPNLARPVELFRGPGLFNGTAEPPAEDSDLLYAVTAWAEGDSLRSVAPIPVTSVARMVTDLAAALSHLHGRCGLVHRDLHPGNVIIDEHGAATLIDLGAVRPDDGTHTVTIAGTLGFIAPERINEPGDGRADAWALGMLVVFALLGHPKGRQTHLELRAQLAAALADSGDPDLAATLILSMLASDPEERPTDVVAWAGALNEALGGRAEPATSRRRPAIAAALGAMVVLAAVVGVDALGGETRRRGDQGSVGTEGVPAGPCTAADFPTVDVATAAGGGCPAGRASRFGEALVQPIRTGGDEKVVVSSTFGSVVLTAAQMASYREIAGRDRPENATTYGGYPVAVVDDGDLHVMELSASGIIVGRRPDTQSFWMPGPVVELWRSRGGVAGDLGVPMTNPYFAKHGLLQDFERGRVLLPSEIPPFTQVDPSLLVVTIDDSPGSGLAGLRLDGTLLRQPTGTVWFVDGGRRRWVPNGDVYACLGGDRAVVADNVSGSDIASLALGEPMTCRR